MGMWLRCPFLSRSVSQSLPQPPCSLPRDENLGVEENLSPYWTAGSLLLPQSLKQTNWMDTNFPCVILEAQ